MNRGEVLWLYIALPQLSLLALFPDEAYEEEAADEDAARFIWAMLPEPYLGPTPEDYGDPGWSDSSVPEHPDDDLPMTLPTFKLLPDYPHLEPSDASGSGVRVVGSGVARAPSEWALRFPASLRGVQPFEVLLEDPSITQAQRHSKVKPTTDATETSLLRSTMGFFTAAEASWVYASGTEVPASYRAVISEFVAGLTEDLVTMIARLYLWYSTRPKELCVLLCAYAVHARSSKGKGVDGFGAKFTPSSLRHRFNCIAHQMLVYHQAQERHGCGAKDFSKPQFLERNHAVWGELWTTVDGACKLAAAAGEVSLLPKRAQPVTAEAIAAAQPMLDTTTPDGLQNQALLYIGVNGHLRVSELHALKRSHFQLVKDPQDTAGRDMYQLCALACKNWTGGLSEAGRPPPKKYIAPNAQYTPMGDPFVDAKYCPFYCIKLFLEKIPADCGCDNLFLRPNLHFRAKNRWYIGQPLSVRTLAERIFAITGQSSHCLKRTGATALAEDESFTDEYRLDMGGWKSRDSMAAYAHHGAAKRGKASAMMSAKVSLAPPAAKEVADVWAPAATSLVPAVAAPAAAPATPTAPCVASSQYAVGVVAPPPLSQQESAVPAVSASVPAAQAAGSPCMGSSSCPPPPSSGVPSFAAMWPGNCGQFAGQLSMMSQQMSAFQLQMQMSSIQLQMQSMQKLMESSKESSKE
ncbi:hypothetical protein QJQ45_008627 [Haematococcus lacustris]|nr:hypothetical protein QJQ45_008627 [Haematococcus lacustris]